MKIALLIFGLCIGTTAYAANNNNGTWTVQSGETLYYIAASYHPYDENKKAKLRRKILQDNPNSFIDGNPSKLEVGEVLKVPVIDEAIVLEPLTLADLKVNETEYPKLNLKDSLKPFMPFTKYLRLYRKSKVTNDEQEEINTLN